MTNVFIFRYPDPETQDYYYFANWLTQKSSPNCPYNKILSCFCLMQYLKKKLWEMTRNYVSMIITIVSNIIVLVSHNVIFFGYFMPTNHGVNRNTPHLLLFHSPLPGFHQGCCSTINASLTFFCLDRFCIFKVKQFFVSTHGWSILILLFRLYVFFIAFSLLFHHRETTNQ